VLSGRPGAACDSARLPRHRLTPEHVSGIVARYQVFRTR
jgi:hypothetical protein